MKHAPHIDKPLDTTIEIVTPENIRFSYQLAGPFLRIFSFGVDLMLGMMIAVAVTILNFFLCDFLWNSLAFDLESFFFGITFIEYFIFFWFENAFFEIIFSGRTIGKMIFGLRVVSLDGQPATISQILLRNILRMADLLFGPFLVFVMAGNERLMRLGDMAAGTIVIRDNFEKIRRSIVTFKHPQIVQFSATIPVDFEFSSELEKMLTLYVHRRTLLSPLCREEIASPLRRYLAATLTISRELNSDIVLCGLYHWAVEHEKI